jgi:hypothetical protein
MREEALALPARNTGTSSAALIGANIGAAIACVLIVLAIFAGIYIVMFGWFFAIVLGISKAANRGRRRGMW